MNKNKLMYKAQVAILTILAVFFMFSASWATTYYVAKNGKDSNPGTEAKPWLIIQKAANTAVAGDIVHVKAGTYNERIEIKKSGSPGAYIIFQNYEDDEVTIDATGIEPIGPGNPVIHLQDKSYIKIIGFHIAGNQGVGIYVLGESSHVEVIGNTITNMKGPDGTGIGFGSWPGNLGNHSYFRIDSNEVAYCEPAGMEAISIGGGSHYFKITNNHVHHNNNIGIDVIGWPSYGESGKGVIKGNVSHHNTSTLGAAGIYIDGVNYIIVEDNISYENSSGIGVGSEIAGDTAVGNIVRRNVFYNNKQGLEFGGYERAVGRVENCVFVNNTFYNNSDQEINIKWASNNALKNNIFYSTRSALLVQWEDSGINALDYNCQYPSEATFVWRGTQYESFSAYQARSGQDANSIAQDTKFVDPSSFDFHLQSSSPCIDKGGFLTKTTNSGSGKTLKVEDARYFTDGFGIIEGDSIQVGSNSPVRIANVNYDTNTITVDKNISWNKGNGVSYSYSGSAPDIGAYEYGGSGKPTPPTGLLIVK